MLQIVISPITIKLNVANLFFSGNIKLTHSSVKIKFKLNRCTICEKMKNIYVNKA